MNARFLVVALTVSLAGCGGEVPMSDESQPPQDAVVYSGKGGGGGGSPLLLNHGGTVLTNAKTEAIFWGDWSSPQDKVSGLDSFFAGLGGSNFAATSDEYVGTNGQVTSTSTYLGHVFDTSAAPRKALTTAQALAEVCKVVPTPDPYAIYFLYTSTGAGSATYCSWHASGTCGNGMPVLVAYMPNLDGIAGCDPGDTTSGHSQGLAALANQTSKVFSGARTNPRQSTWYDSSNQENGDKCAWSFPPSLDTLSNGSTWKLQMEWSNAAYTAGTGRNNLSGQPGCI
jgi:hypothetical protein